MLQLLNAQDPRVGAWDWYHIKSWDVAPNHFAFKIVAAKDAAAVNYRFNTKQVKLSTSALCRRDECGA